MPDDVIISPGDLIITPGELSARYHHLIGRRQRERAIQPNLRMDRSEHIFIYFHLDLPYKDNFHSRA